MTDKPTPKSARDIEVPGIFDNKRAIGPGVSKNDVGDTLIEAAIEEGVRGKGAIIDLLQGLGLTRGHVATLLEKDADAAAPRWRRDGPGRYRLREQG